MLGTLGLFLVNDKNIISLLRFVQMHIGVWGRLMKRFMVLVRPKHISAAALGKHQQNRKGYAEKYF